MVDLTRIEKPFVLCTKEEQEGLNALIRVKGALQLLSSALGKWETRNGPFGTILYNGRVYRQNPDWNPPTLDVPDWFWENTDFNHVVMHLSKVIYAYELEPVLLGNDWIKNGGRLMYGLENTFTHNFNPLNIPWDQSLTKRPEKFTNDS